MRTRPALLLLAALACSKGVRKDVTPPLASQAAEAAAQQAALTDPPALTHAELIEHALSRVTFGARPEDRARVEKLGVSAFLEEQLHPERIDDAALEKRLGADYTVLQRDSGDMVRQLVVARKMRQEEKKNAQAPAAEPVQQGKMAQPAEPQAGPPQAAEAPERPPRERASKDLRKQLGRAGRGPGFDYVAQLSAAKVLRAVSSERQLQEVMTDFWFNHFNVFAGKEVESALLPEYEQKTLRPNALSTFPELLEATAHSPAMLIYLDNWRSAAPDAPVPRRVRRMWQADPQQQPKRATRGLNENYARELLELHTLGVDGGYTQQDIIEVARCFTGWTVEQPQKDPRFVFRPQLHDWGKKLVLGHEIAPGGGESDADQVLKILENHPATARFIARKLARRFVSDDPPEELVTRIAARYTQTHGDIRSMLRAIFESPEFWSRKAVRAKVRSPLELVASAVRALDGRVDDPLSLARAVARIGEPLYAAQPPTGYGDTAQAWLSSGALLARIDFGLQLANGQLQGVTVDLTKLQSASGEQLVQRAAEQLGAPELSDKTREYVLAQLKEAPPRPDTQARRAVGLLLGAPELQRR